jgi:hypothetical protein
MMCNVLLAFRSAFRENEERKLLKQLRNFYLSADGSQPVNKVGFCSPRTKRYIARQHRESDSSFAAQKSLQPARELEVSKSENSLGVKPLKKTRSYANTPNKKANRSTVTLAKKGNRTPRRTPRKRSGRTPRKSSRLTPAKGEKLVQLILLV